MVILKTRMAIFGECGDVATKGFARLGRPHAELAELAEKKYNLLGLTQITRITRIEHRFFGASRGNGDMCFLGLLGFLGFLSFLGFL